MVTSSSLFPGVEIDERFYPAITAFGIGTGSPKMNNAIPSHSFSENVSLIRASLPGSEY